MSWFLSLRRGGCQKVSFLQLCLHRSSQVPSSSSRRCCMSRSICKLHTNSEQVFSMLSVYTGNTTKESTLETVSVLTKHWIFECADDDSPTVQCTKEFGGVFHSWKKIWSVKITETAPGTQKITAEIFRRITWFPVSIKQCVDFLYTNC